MKPSSLSDAFGPQLGKSMKNVLCSRFTSEYGFLGGREVIELIVNDLLRVVNDYQVPLNNVNKGQIVWQAVAKDEITAYGKLMRDTRTMPVILTLANDDDIRMRINGTSLDQVRKTVIERILKEADEQGGTLSQTDIAMILAISKTSVSEYIREIQKEKNIILPYRGTIHDLGPTVTHKREILRLKLQKISPPEISRRTYHSNESVDRYINDFERVTRIADKFDPVDIAFITNLSLSLVNEYIELKKEFQQGEKEL